ncbi:MAG: SPW repeat protein [Mycobacterium sp.]
MQTASTINALLGIWLVIAPFALAYSHNTGALWNDIIVGVVVVALAGVRAFVPDNNVRLSWSTAAIGVWLVIAPFALGHSAITANMWNDVVVGIAVGALSVWGAVAGQQMHGPHPVG